MFSTLNLRTIRALGEFGLIERIRKWVPCAPSVSCGIGDDCAVLEGPGRKYQLLTTDTLVENVDFVCAKAKPEEIGWKALAANLSDIAAMGGEPKVAVVSLVLPAHTPITFVRRFCAGLSRLAKRFKVSIVGGDLSRGMKIVSTITVLGEIRRHELVLRKGAKAGDFICVTGKLGGSILGKHLRFTPRVNEGRLIAQSGASSMIDISDGLVQDWLHLNEGSKGARLRSLSWIDEQRVPVSAAAERLARGSRKRAMKHALTDGEDFELLFTISPRRFAKLRKKWTRRFRTPLTCIGEVGKVNSGWEQKCRLLGKKGFRHF